MFIALRPINMLRLWGKEYPFAGQDPLIFNRLNWTVSALIGNNTRFHFDLRRALYVREVGPAALERVSRTHGNKISPLFRRIGKEYLKPWNYR